MQFLYRSEAPPNRVTLSGRGFLFVLTVPDFGFYFYFMELIIVATGDSLRGFDFSTLCNKGYPIWAVNYAANYLSCFDLLICWDGPRPDYPSSAKIETLRQHGGKWIPKGPQLQRKENRVANLPSSVIMAVNIALQHGYKTIYLLGVDNAGSRRFYDDPAAELSWDFERFERYFKIISQGLAPDEKIIAVESSLKVFPTLSLSDFTKKIGCVQY